MSRAKAKDQGGRSRAGADLGLRYLSVAYVVRKTVDDQMIASGLSLSCAKVLQVLEREGPLRQTSLAKSLRLAPRSITQSIEGLERSGLVERHPGPRRSALQARTPHTEWPRHANDRYGSGPTGAAVDLWCP